MSECNHCFTNSTPESKEILNIEQGASLVRELLAKYPITELHFNGGEPFLYPETMRAMIAAGRNEKHDLIIKVATGAAEFRTEEDTKNLLDQLPIIHEVWISFDRYHLKKAPIDNYRHILNLLNARGIKSYLSICYDSAADLANSLNLIQAAGLEPTRTARQPTQASGRGVNLPLVTQVEARIPGDFSCPEKSLVTIHTDGTLSTCSAVSCREGLIARYSDIESMDSSLKTDKFWNQRLTLPFEQIARELGTSGFYDVNSPCAACRTILMKLRKGSHAGKHEG